MSYAGFEITFQNAWRNKVWLAWMECAMVKLWKSLKGINLERESLQCDKVLD